MSSWLVVGVSGVTSGGKSILCKELIKTLPSSTVLLNQDDYFHRDPSYHIPSGVGNHFNWDIVSAIDMSKMLHDIHAIISRPICQSGFRPILILDGFLLFDNKVVSELCELKYFLFLTKEECWKRRQNRIYDPPDVPGYFELCAWPRYKSYLKRVKDMYSDVTYLDGAQSMADTLSRIYSEIKSKAHLL